MLLNSSIIQGRHVVRKNHLSEYGIFFIHFTLLHGDGRALSNRSK
jgi:hypothetical protein